MSGAVQGGSIPETSAFASLEPGTPSGSPLQDGCEDWVQVGVLRSPSEFVDEAKKVPHPMDSANPLEAVTLAALRENLTITFLKEGVPLVGVRVPSVLRLQACARGLD